MMNINNISNCIYENFAANELFVCALGYEERSFYLLGRNLDTRNINNTLVFQFGDFDQNSLSAEIEKYISQLPKGHLIKVSYGEYKIIQESVIAFLESQVNNNLCNDNICLHIDYSSMPRSWYCNLPTFIESNKSSLPMHLDIKFWYVAGDYPQTYNNYPTAGISNFSVFSGNVLPKIDSRRTHLVALSYDAKRTQGILSITEPELLIVCYAYNTTDGRKKKKEVEKINEDIIRRATVSVALPMNDFIYILGKTREIIFEHTYNEQIVVIPDGPKPLIFAMSLASLLNQDDDVTCLHINRNETIAAVEQNKVRVVPRKNEIYGMKYSISHI
jgi:hypothetical protein